MRLSNCTVYIIPQRRVQVKKKLVLTGEIWQEGNMYTSYCPELDVASCGHTEEEARRNLLEVIEIFIDKYENCWDDERAIF